MLPLSKSSTEDATKLPKLTDSSELFRDLKRRIDAAGLLNRHPARYLATGALLLCGLVVSVSLMVRYGGNVPIQAANGALLAFLYTQIGFVMHDAGHRQVFRSVAANDYLGLVCANLLIGLSFDWWKGKHNRHHSHPNHEDHDPDIEFPMLAFSERQALSTLQRWRWIVRYQAFFFIPLLLFVGISMRSVAIAHVIRSKIARPWLEAALLLTYFATYIGLVLSLLEYTSGIVFVLVNQGLSGFYTGSVFAPNHKGMPVLTSDQQIGFLERQVFTSRNVRGGFLTDLIYGGLNYQIEHHLFPRLPRYRLRAARRVVRAFCLDHGIPYAETGVIRSFTEILIYLHRVSCPLRRSRHRPRGRQYSSTSLPRPLPYVSSEGKEPH